MPSAPSSLCAALPSQLLLHVSPTSQHAFAVVREGGGDVRGGTERRRRARAAH